LPLKSYNRKLGHKIGRFTIKSEALAALIYTVPFSQCENRVLRLVEMWKYKCEGAIFPLYIDDTNPNRPTNPKRPSWRLT